MKNQPKTNHRRRPAWVEMFAKTRGGGAAADGRDWHTDVPNIKLSRAFVVVLVLHVVAVGGILAFELFKPGGDTAANAEREPAKPVLTADTPAAPAPQTPAARREARLGGYESYIVQAGDSIRAVAEQYGISRTELLAANRIDEQHPLVAGRLLRIPKALLPGGSSANLQPVSREETARPGTPGLASSIEPETHTVLPVPGPLEVADEDDGFQPLITPPVSPTPTPEPAPAPVPEVASTSPPERPAPASDDGEDAPVTIVAPQPDQKPKVTRTVPAARPVTTAEAASEARSHTVVAGETLYRISRRYGVTVDALLAANPGVEPSTLGIGKQLRIP